MSDTLPSNGPRPILFRLPRELRDEIYRLVLLVPHPLHLFADGYRESPKISLFAPERPRQWLSLLSANHQIRNEASAILYGAHQFMLVETWRPLPQSTLLMCNGTLMKVTTTMKPLLEWFLGSVRSVDAGHLRHICIDFPAVDRKGSGGGGEGSRGVGERSEEAASSMLRKEDLRALKLLQDKCHNLTTLETRVDDRNSRGLVVPRGRGESMSLDDVKKALAEVEELVKGIVSPEKVVVKWYHGPLKPEVEKLMWSFGWTVMRGR